MTQRRGFFLLIRAGVPALFIGVAVSGTGRVSVKTWVAAAAVWVAASLLRDFITVAEPELDRRPRAWRLRKRRRQDRPLRGPRAVQMISLLLDNARENPRVHANALRPRLMALAQHYIPIRHGFDLEHRPDRLASLLGDLAWLIDPAVTDRTPTLGEIESFIDTILAEHAAVPPSTLARHEGVAT